MLVHSAKAARGRALLGLGFLASALALSASSAAAQKQVAATDYRLTMPVLRKAFPAIDGSVTKSCPEPKRSMQELAELTVAQVEAWQQGCAPVRKVAAAQGITMRELAQVSTALFQTSWRMMQEENAKATGGSLAPLPPGPLRDNVAFMREHLDEIAQLGNDN